MEMAFMEYLERFRNSIPLLFLTMMISCSPNEIRLHLKVNEESSIFIQKEGLMYVNNQLFSGELYRLYPNSIDTMTSKHFINGKKEGIWKKFYENQGVSEVRQFSNGQKIGVYDGWWPNGQRKFSYSFKNDEYDGVSKEWNLEERLVREMNYEKGYEQGSQKIWYNNGKIKSNYVVKKGRRYGLLGTKNCVNASDSLFLE
jgi:antitoxin component YwqK of YwqJK toxin-antitoxin module